MLDKINKVKREHIIKNGDESSPFAISLIDICKSFGPVQANDAISLDVTRGTIHGIIGENGAGKSTLMSIIYGFYQPDSGMIKVAGTPVSFKQPSDAISLGIGMVHQHFMLVPNFTALENIMIALNVKNKDKVENRKHAVELLEWVGLEDRITHYPKELSAGQQQRVAIARALINDPKLILADEPSGNLDKANAVALHNLFFELRNEFHHSFVIVTHNEELASQADRKIVMSDGQII